MISLSRNLTKISTLFQVIIAPMAQCTLSAAPPAVRRAATGTHQRRARNPARPAATVPRAQSYTRKNASNHQDVQRENGVEAHHACVPLSLQEL